MAPIVVSWWTRHSTKWWIWCSRKGFDNWSNRIRILLVFNIDLSCMLTSLLWIITAIFKILFWSKSSKAFSRCFAGKGGGKSFDKIKKGKKFSFEGFSFFSPLYFCFIYNEKKNLQIIFNWKKIHKSKSKWYIREKYRNAFSRKNLCLIIYRRPEINKKKEKIVIIRQIMNKRVIPTKSLYILTKDFTA